MSSELGLPSMFANTGSGDFLPAPGGASAPHPFQVAPAESSGGQSLFRVVPGTISRNHTTPAPMSISGINSTFALGSGSFVYLRGSVNTASDEFEVALSLEVGSAWSDYPKRIVYRRSGTAPYDYYEQTDFFCLVGYVGAPPSAAAAGFAFTAGTTELFFYQMLNTNLLLQEISDSGNFAVYPFSFGGAA